MVTSEAPCLTRLGTTVCVCEPPSVAVGAEIAQGGYAVVYSARDTRTGEVFALKKLLCQSAEQVERAKTEIQTLTTLAHPHVMPLADYAVVSVDASTFEYYLLFPFMQVQRERVMDNMLYGREEALLIAVLWVAITERHVTRDDRCLAEVRGMPA